MLRGFLFLKLRKSWDWKIMWLTRWMQLRSNRLEMRLSGYGEFDTVYDEASVVHSQQGQDLHGGLIWRTKEANASKK